MKAKEIIKNILSLGITNENCGTVIFGARENIEFVIAVIFGDVKNWCGIEPDTEYLYMWLPEGSYCPFGDPDGVINTDDGDVIYLIKMED